MEPTRQGRGPTGTGEARRPQGAPGVRPGTRPGGAGPRPQGSGGSGGSGAPRKGVPPAGQARRPQGIPNGRPNAPNGRPSAPNGRPNAPNARPKGSGVPGGSVAGQGGPNQRRRKKKKKSSRVWILLFLLLFLLLVALGIGIWQFLYANQNKSRLARDEDALGGMLEGKTPDEISKILSEKVEEGMVNVSISAEPVFEQRGKRGLIGIENLETNRYSFVVEIIGDNDLGTVYKSGLVEPGYYVEYVELSKRLEPGKYPATAVFTTYSLDETEDPIAQANVRIVLNVIEGDYYQ